MDLVYSGLLILFLVSSFPLTHSRGSRNYGWNQGYMGFESKGILDAIRSREESGENIYGYMTEEYRDKVAKFFHGVHKEGKELESVLGRFQEIIKEEEKASNLRTCALDYGIYLRDLFAGKPYALKMYDSNGVRESGVLPGNWAWTGAYFECTETNTTRFEGQWCDVYQGDLYNPSKLGYPGALTIGVCFPSSCNDESVAAIFPIVSGSNVTDTPFYFATCTKPPSTLYARDIIGITITAILVLLIVVSTSFDIISSLSNNNQVGEEMTVTRRDQGIGVRLLLCFSAYTNTKKLLDMTKRKDNMTVLDGIRFITMTWVILGHSIYFPMFKMDNTSQAVQFVRNHPSMQVLTNATFSVDTFFCLGGFLVSLLTLKQLKKTNGKINIPLMYLHRYIRITPTYAYCILFVISIYRWIGSGPFYPAFADASYETCKDDWWTNLLYISNLYPPSSCIGWVWYLANDMQFYIFSPFLLLLLYGTPIVGISVLIFLVIADMTISGTLANVSELQPDQLGTLFYAGVFGLTVPYDPEASLADNYRYDIYTKPYTRMGAYIIGMLAGYLIYRGKGKVRLHKVVVVLGWIISTGVSLAIIYGLTDYVVNFTFPSTDLAAFYVAVTRPAWSACVAWVVIACLSGYGGYSFLWQLFLSAYPIFLLLTRFIFKSHLGPITTFLSWKVFIPLSRLTFCAYLIHPMVLSWYTGTQESEIHFLLGNIVFLYLGVIVLSFGLGYVLSMMVEGPFMSMQKILFGAFQPKPREDKNEEPNMQAVNGLKMEKKHVNGSLPVIENNYATVATAGDTISKL